MEQLVSVNVLESILKKKDCESATLEVSSGLSRKFSIDNYDSEYFLVSTQVN